MIFDLINKFAKRKSNASPDDPDSLKEFIQHFTNNLELLKEFVQHLAFDINGLKAYNPDEKVDINKAKGTIV